MIIQINADWRVRSDPLQWILDRRRTLRKRDTGEEYEDWHVEGFYATLDGAVVGCIEHRLRFMEGGIPPRSLEHALYGSRRHESGHPICPLWFQRPQARRAIMKNLTRRTVLRGGAAVGAVGVTAGVATTAAHALAADHELIALEKTWLALWREEKRNSEQCQKAEATLPAWARCGDDQWGNDLGWPELDINHPAFANAWHRLSTRSNRETIERYNREMEAGVKAFARYQPARASEILDAERRLAADRVRHFEERLRERDECGKRAGVTALDDASDRLNDEITAIEDKMENTPAHTIEGVAIKLRLYATIESCKPPEEAELEDDGDCLLTEILAEIDRLAGRGS